MRFEQTGRRWASLGSFLLVLTGCLASAWAQQEKSPAEKPTLKAAEVQGYLGDWVLTMTSQRGKSRGSLTIRDEQGMAVASLKTRMEREPRTITNLAKTADGLTLQYRVDLQGREMNMKMNLKLAGEKLTGDSGDERGGFSMQIAGVRKGSADDKAAGADDSGDDSGGAGARMGLGNVKLTLGGKDVVIFHGTLTTKGRDYKRLAALKDGEIATFEDSIAIKLKTAADLKFGDTAIKAGNYGPTYPGVYSLWLKKAGAGWKLVFNSESDVWGTMHDPKADVAETPIESGKSAEASDKFKVELKADGATGGVLRIAWGDQEWKAKFAVAP